MIDKTRLSAEDLAINFADLYSPFSRDEAVSEASRCVYCYDAPCTRSCPTGIDVPRFIRQILHENTRGAAETIFTDNVLGGSCARACPTEVLCEGACVDRTLFKEPVQIGRLQRYATDSVSQSTLDAFAPGAPSGKRVALVGSGPAGMSCAATLRRMGHAVTIFESRDVPGGLNTLGIAAYKISTELALSEWNAVKNMGVEIELNHPVDSERLQELRSAFHAVFIGVGLGSTACLGIPGERLSGVMEALDFIFQTHTLPLTDCVVGRKVVVIGAGNTAIDTATEAVRLGADTVTVLYRRGRSEMSAFDYEYRLALGDGIGFDWHVQPVGFLGANGALCGVQVQKMRQVGSGRGARLEPVPDSVYTIECDMAVQALGQTPVLGLVLREEGVRIEEGKLKVDPETGATGAPGLFAGGDCTSGGAEIVDAVQDGKRAAFAINEYLGGQQ
jgi:dihydropyrimidine dehydrogenase (NAD+) subunit PreT